MISINKSGTLKEYRDIREDTEFDDNNSINSNSNNNNEKIPNSNDTNCKEAANFIKEEIKKAFEIQQKGSLFFKQNNFKNAKNEFLKVIIFMHFILFLIVSHFLKVYQ